MVHAKRSLGQNFLVDAGIQRRIVAALQPSAGDVVVEIGPGRGALTRHLAGRVARLFAIELDDALAETLRQEYAGQESVQIVHADVMRVALGELVRGTAPPAPLKIVGNIPYNITTPIVFHLLEAAPSASLIVLMVQKEVADRMLASPGGKEYGALTVGLRAVADVERLFNVGRAAFQPAPDVLSTVIRVQPHVPRGLDEAGERDLRALTRVAFSWRRKQLQKILRGAPAYGLTGERVARLAAELGLDPTARPETLSPEQFVRLARALRARGLPAAPSSDTETRTGDR